MAPSYLYQAPAGVPGDITRPDESNVEPIMLKQDGSPLAYPQAFGIPMKYVTGGAAAIVTGDVAADFAGVLVREVPQISGNSNQGFTDAIPNPDQANGMCVRGYVSVLCVAGTPTRGGVVYMQVTSHSGAVPGDLRADGTDSGNAVALSLTQASWASDGKDSSNNAELRIAR